MVLYILFIFICIRPPSNLLSSLLLHLLPGTFLRPFFYAGKNITCYCNQPTEDCIRVNSGWGQCSMPVGEGVCLATWEKIPQLNVVAYTYTCSSNLIDLFVCQPSRPHLIGSSLNFITTCCLTNYCNTPDYLMSVVNVLGKYFCSTIYRLILPIAALEWFHAG